MAAQLNSGTTVEVPSPPRVQRIFTSAYALGESDRHRA